MVTTFKDANGNAVSFSTDIHTFSTEPNHVLVLVHSKEGWIFTHHKKRGLEFPGGKREQGESIEQAAIREVWEETGVHIKQLTYIGQYKVTEQSNSFVKNVYFAHALSIVPKKDYMETNGAVIIQELPDEFIDDRYSFIMRDQVIRLSLQQVASLQLI